MLKKFARTLRPTEGDQKPVVVDAFDVAAAFGIHCPAMAQALANILYAEGDPQKRASQKIGDAIDCLVRAREFAWQRERAGDAYSQQIEPRKNKFEVGQPVRVRSPYPGSDGQMLDAEIVSVFDKTHDAETVYGVRLDRDKGNPAGPLPLGRRESQIEPRDVGPQPGRRFRAGDAVLFSPDKDKGLVPGKVVSVPEGGSPHYVVTRTDGQHPMFWLREDYELEPSEDKANEEAPQADAPADPRPYLSAAGGGEFTVTEAGNEYGFAPGSTIAFAPNCPVYLKARAGKVLRSQRVDGKGCTVVVDYGEGDAVVGVEVLPGVEQSVSAGPPPDRGTPIDWEQIARVRQDSGGPAAPDRDVTFTYRNHRGEVADRRVRPAGLWFGKTEHHPRPCWLLRGLDLDKDQWRDFDLGRITDWAGGRKSYAPAGGRPLAVGDRVLTFTDDGDKVEGVVEAVYRAAPGAAPRHVVRLDRAARSLYCVETSEWMRPIGQGRVAKDASEA